MKPLRPTIALCPTLLLGWATVLGVASFLSIPECANAAHLVPAVQTGLPSPWSVGPGSGQLRVHNFASQDPVVGGFDQSQRIDRASEPADQIDTILYEHSNTEQFSFGDVVLAPLYARGVVSYADFFGTVPDVTQHQVGYYCYASAASEAGNFNNGFSSSFADSGLELVIAGDLFETTSTPVQLRLDYWTGSDNQSNTNGNASVSGSVVVFNSSAYVLPTQSYSGLGIHELNITAHVGDVIMLSIAAFASGGGQDALRNYQSLGGFFTASLDPSRSFFDFQSAFGNSVPLASVPEPSSGVLCAIAVAVIVLLPKPSRKLLSCAMRSACIRVAGDGLALAMLGATTDVGDLS